MVKIHYTDSLNYELERTARALKLRGVQLFNNLNITITPDEFCALDIISCHDEICQRDVAKYLLKDRANTGRILNSLEENNLITRTDHRRNNRLIKKIELTKDGEKLLNEISSKIDEHVSQMISPLQEKKVKLLVESIKLFRENLENALELKI